MRAGIICLALMISPAHLRAEFAAATGSVSPDIISLEAGIVCPPVSIGSTPAPGTVAGTTHIIEKEPPFVSNARRVPAVLGIGFGVKSQTDVVGGLDGVTWVVSHPSMGGDNVETQNFVTRISDLKPSFKFYQFDYAYELLPGPWQMTAMRGENILYQVNFDVVPPEAVPELARVCGYLDLLS